jgi:prevent-host-death family protein
MDVGVRELKAHLSEYLAHVRDGEQVVVTSRGRPVARIEPMGLERLPAKMQALIRSGRMIDKGPPRYIPRSVRMTPGDKTSTDLVREQRH